MKNKILLCFIVISLIFCITSCGNNDNNPGIIENTEGKLIINGYDLTLDAESSFYKINFKYPSKATISNPVTSLVIDYPKKNSKESLFKVAMGYMYGSNIDDSMKGFTKVETKTINDIEWTIYKDQNGRNNYGINRNYSNIVIGFIYDDNNLSKFEEDFMNNVTLNK